jgi:hypothetical protein
LSPGSYGSNGQYLFKAIKRQLSSGKVDLASFPVPSGFVQFYGSWIAGIGIQANAGIRMLPGILLCEVHQSARNALALARWVNAEPMHDKYGFDATPSDLLVDSILPLVQAYSP